MKPYAFNPNKSNDVGCCPGHDWPRCYRWAGKYKSPNSMRNASDSNKVAKRIRRRTDKQDLNKEINEGF